MGFSTFKRSQFDSNYLEILLDFQVLEEVFFPFKVEAPSFGFSSQKELLLWLETYEMTKAKEVAYKLLSMSAYSCKALSMKLKLKGFSEKTIKEVLEKVASQGFVNDENQAKQFMEKKLSRGCGPLKIQKLLLAKGYKADSCLKISEEDQLQIISSYSDVLKKLDKKKQIAFLRKKGFSGSIILKALNELFQ